MCLEVFSGNFDEYDDLPQWICFWKLEMAVCQNQ
jgi:hypothetical protein